VISCNITLIPQAAAEFERLVLGSMLRVPFSNDDPGPCYGHVRYAEAVRGGVRVVGDCHDMAAVLLEHHPQSVVLGVDMIARWGEHDDITHVDRVLAVTLSAAD
jgi:hypothetical protein